ncbi:MAG: acylglycerol kinase family protein, partial [Eubacterium sp.]|nr:acylglycerol kinase family protein [Eubacterium sp.]
MEKKRLLFIYNPLSGRRTIKDKLYDIIQIFSESGYDILIHPTQAEKDARDTVSRLGGECSLIVCSGGDGTLNEVVTAVMDGDIKKDIGYIPAGSTNDFAHSLDLSRDLVEAAGNILNEKGFACDVGWFNSRY